MTFADNARDLFGINLSPEQVTEFTVLEAELIEWNQRMNLTAITEPEVVRVRHFLDSLSVSKVVDLNRPLKLVDIGSGAGFPGLPIAMTFPQVQVTLMDSTGKKVRYIQHVIDTLGLANATAVQMRAETAGQDGNYREQYDVVVARAVARLPGLVEYLLPLTKIGGVSIAMKGTTAHDEAQDAARAITAFGGKLDKIEDVQLPDVDIPHYLIAINKVSRTPPEFPRQPGTPTREPIE